MTEATTSSASSHDAVHHQMYQPGRVLRLHFTCRAEVPIGSFLRVTGSTLWAPGTSALDPTEAAPTVEHINHLDYTGNAGHGTSQNGSLINGRDTITSSNLYTSSVEMVTTPETYPIWKTRRPVILLWNRRGSGGSATTPVLHHYYRYLVVAPGTVRKPHSSALSLALPSTDGTTTGTAGSGQSLTTVQASTSNEATHTGSTIVMEWEDPFYTMHQNNQDVTTTSSSALFGSAHSSTTSLLPGGGGMNKPSRNVSAVSLNSSVHLASMTNSGTQFRNLPYRTIDVHATTTTTANSSVDGGSSSSSSSSSSVILNVMDHWNNPDDPTFQPYRIRDAIHEENRRKMIPTLPTTAASTSYDAMDTDEGVASSTGPSPRSSTNNMHRPPIQHQTMRQHQQTSSGMATPPAFSVNNRIFFVCFHLPVVVVQNPTTMEWQASWSESILARSEGSQILSTYQGHWVGTVTTLPPLQTDADREIVRGILEQMKCIPIFLDPAVRQSHYYGFCKQVLWPAFHNIDLLDMSTCGFLSDPTSVASDWDQGRLEDWWHAYIAVNEEFSTKMTSMLRSGDIVWIHDYHLSLLPQKLTSWEVSKFGKKVTRKVFFLHIPFPTSQIFRELECGEKILTGMLHADVVGFHAFDHARHFLNAAKRILGLNYESLAGGLIGVNFEGSTVLVSMSNVSIEPRMIDAALMLPSVQIGRDQIKRMHAGRTIISGVDIGQRLSGASLKLLAYERLLQDYPSWQPHVVMVQRILLPGSRRADEELTTKELRALVQRIQEKFGTAVIDYQEIIGSSLPMDQRLALWRASDILMSTAIREGLNHWPMEFIYAHKEPEEPGLVITSEFSAVSSILNGALRVNPYDIQATITMIDRALSMDKHEREGRRYRDMFFVSSSPSDKWVKNVLRDLRDATSASTAGSGGDSASQISTPYATPSPAGNLLVDSTAAFLARESSLAFKHLHRRDLKRAYDATRRRVIILDFNGTIVLKEPPGKYLKREILGTSGNKPPPEVIEALTRLCSDARNTVYVVSGDSSENVLTAVGHVPRLGLAVSNGACFSPPNDHPSIGQRPWLTFDLGVDWDAVKKVALPVLSKYTARSNGSFVKLTKFSIGWSYYSCDPEWGSLQAMYLVMELENELRSFDVRFVTLKGIVEIVPRKLNKGLIVKKVLHDTTTRTDLEGDGVDFILCCGDDISDEKMFSSVYNFLSEMGDGHAHQSGSGVPPVFEDQPSRNAPTIPIENMMDTTQLVSKVPDQIYAFTVAVGKKETHACTYVNDAQEVANALVMLAGGTVPAEGVQVWGRANSSTMFA